MMTSLFWRKQSGNHFSLLPYFTSFSRACNIGNSVILTLCRTTIEWLPGKCLTQKILKKKPKKGLKNAKPITKTEDCESFFNFFSPPEVPDDAEEDMVRSYKN